MEIEKKEEETIGTRLRKRTPRNSKAANPLLEGWVPKNKRVSKKKKKKEVKPKTKKVAKKEKETKTTKKGKKKARKKTKAQDASDEEAQDGKSKPATFYF